MRHLFHADVQDGRAPALDRIQLPRVEVLLGRVLEAECGKQVAAGEGAMSQNLLNV